MKRSVLFILGACLLLASAPAAEVTPAEQAAIDRISADSLRVNLTFIASDALQGRYTPSAGLHKAAEYIADQFRKAGLEAPVNGTYFQNAPYAEFTPKLDDFRLTLKTAGNELNLSGADVRVRASQALDLSGAPVIDLPSDEDIKGKIVAGDARNFGTEAALTNVQSRRPALILLTMRRALGRGGPQSYVDDAASEDAPVIRIGNADANAAVSDHKALTVSIHMAAPSTRPAPVENVIGALPGSDPRLRDEYVILSAHYDHLGVLNGQIYNGANDNGSGTVSVIEIARALSAVHPRPKRTIVFMTFFGEEEGLLGAYFYTHHPVFPLAKTVADINLEQMGRTDDKDERRVASFSFTGPSYSDLPATMTSAAKQEHIGIYVKPDADDFFNRSDNYAFAEAGIVAHTAVVAYEYRDYHAPGDKVDKIDFRNMAAVDRGIAAGLLEIADAADTPHWSEDKKAAVYREAVKRQAN